MRLAQLLRLGKRVNELPPPPEFLFLVPPFVFWSSFTERPDFPKKQLDALPKRCEAFERPWIGPLSTTIVFPPSFSPFDRPSLWDSLLCIPLVVKPLPVVELVGIPFVWFFFCCFSFSRTGQFSEAFRASFCVDGGRFFEETTVGILWPCPVFSFLRSPLLHQPPPPTPTESLLPAVWTSLFQSGGPRRRRWSLFRCCGLPFLVRRFLRWCWTPGMALVLPKRRSG